MNGFSMFMHKNKPGILIGLGISSMLMSIGVAYIYAPLAKDALDDKKDELGVDKLHPIDTIKTVWPYVTPSLVFASAGVACILGGNQINLNRGTAAMTAYMMSESALRSYRDSAKEVVGEKKEKDIREAAAKKMYYDDLQNGRMTVITNGCADDFWMYDHLTRQKFRSNVQKVKDAVNNLNYRIVHGEVLSVCDYCLEMNEEPVEMGKNFVWDVNRNGLIELYPPTAYVMENGEPVIDIMHRVDPVPLY